MIHLLRQIVASFWFKAALSVALLAVLLWETDVSQLVEVVARADLGWLLIAFLGYFLSQVLSVIRWRMLAHPVGFREPFWRYFISYFRGMYMNLFAPSTVAGDIGRALLLAGGVGRRTLAFTSVFADRALGFVALTWIGAIAILAQPGYSVPRLLYYSAWVVPPGTLAAWLMGPLLLARLLPMASRWRLLVEQDLAAYWNDWSLLSRTMLLAAVFHLVQIGTQVALAWALQISAPVSFFLIFVPVVNILGMLPISFSGVGVREAGYVVALATVGVDREFAMALGLLSSVVVLVSGVASGLALFANQPPPVLPPGRGTRARDARL